MAITPGVQFGMEGPVMTGTWINPKTGHKFTVRDTFFQDNQFMVQTTDGQMLDYNTIQNYIQCNDNNGQAIEPTSDIVEHRAEDIPKEVAAMVAEPVLGPAMNPDTDLIIPEDASLGNIYSDNKAPVAIDPDPDMAMVARVLKRHAQPKIVPQITWDVPQKQIETLIDVLGIEPNTIARYYINKLDNATITKEVIEAVAEHIKNIIEHPVKEIVVQQAPVTTKHTTKRTKK